MTHNKDLEVPELFQRDKSQVTISEAQQVIVPFLTKHGLEKPLHDSKQILSHYTKIPPLELNLFYQRYLSEDEAELIVKALQRRALHEPLQYIFGKSSFMGMEFIVNEKVLIPRYETELLVEKILQDQSLFTGINLLDIGTGCGNIAVSIAKYRPDWQIEATDNSDGALETARRNAEENQVEITLYKTDLFPPQKTRYNVIVSNPPYIPLQEYKQLSPQVRLFEPQEALLALPSNYQHCPGIKSSALVRKGLFYYDRILREATYRLKPDGRIYFEIGYNQAKDIRDLAKALNYRVVDIIKDFQQFERIVIISPLA